LIDNAVVVLVVAVEVAAVVCLDPTTEDAPAEDPTITNAFTGFRWNVLVVT
jgi:hypothetical protein